jgi:16S rRNA A1518/A1519 N6-dimethyltransferase RsmA/KsgA/DIM1 with predicted DNA glycosylase/AP lyase activity
MSIIKQYSIKAKKSLGQNFLEDENILNNISSFYPAKNEQIIEV